jgi:hypothetical protein
MPRSKAVSGRVLLVPQVSAIHSNGAEHGYNVFMSLPALAAAHRSIRNWLSLTTNSATNQNIRASGKAPPNPPRWPHCDEGLAAEVVKAFRLPTRLALPIQAVGPFRGRRPPRRFVMSGAHRLARRGISDRLASRARDAVPNGN